MKYSLMKRQSERVEAGACGNSGKPPAREPCHGDCLLKSWQYSAWSQVRLEENAVISTTPQSPVEVKDCVSVVVKVLRGLV